MSHSRHVSDHLCHRLGLYQHHYNSAPLKTASLQAEISLPQVEDSAGN